MIFTVKFEGKALSDIKKIIKSGKQSDIKKLEDILEELKIHPLTGTGHPEPLKHHLSGCWSRRLNKKDRLVYQILEDEVIVVVVSALGHY
ncbi:MAG: Txe/YoeB family addiction module toxin [Saprospiraceae bacterium]|jgi:toxin YoeB|nr:Txe/YoeB family addiction module toxin [Saprospiraceae bacterium]